MMTNDELYEASSSAYSVDMLRKLWKEHSAQIIADWKLRELYDICSMSCDGP